MYKVQTCTLLGICPCLGCRMPFYSAYELYSSVAGCRMSFELAYELNFFLLTNDLKCLTNDWIINSTYKT